MEIDRYDREILAILQRDGRISNQDLADRIGLSPSPCLRRVRTLEEAGLILAVFDGSEPLTREDLALAQRCAGRPAIALVNKEDKPTQFDAEIIAGDFAMVLPVCCQEEGSRRVIAAAVARLLGTNNIDPHAASLSGQRQLAAHAGNADQLAEAVHGGPGGHLHDKLRIRQCCQQAPDGFEEQRRHVVDFADPAAGQHGKG